MNDNDWKNIKYFKKDESTPWGTPNAFGDSSKLNLYLMMQLDAMREYVGKPFGIHCGYDTNGHTSNSYHSRDNICRAIDFSCEEIPLFELFIVAAKFSFEGIGMYPYWNRPGLHVDVRGIGKFQPRVMWWQDWNKEYHYL